MAVDVVHHVLAHDQRVPEGPEIRLQVGDRPASAAIGQQELEMAVEAGDERLRIERDRGREISHRLGEVRIRREPCPTRRQVAGEASGHDRMSDELRRAARRHEVRQHLVSTSPSAT